MCKWSRRTGGGRTTAPRARRQLAWMPSPRTAPPTGPLSAVDIVVCQGWRGERRTARNRRVANGSCAGLPSAACGRAHGLGEGDVESVGCVIPGDGQDETQQGAIGDVPLLHRGDLVIGDLVRGERDAAGKAKRSRVPISILPGASVARIRDWCAQPAKGIGTA